MGISLAILCFLLFLSKDPLPVLILAVVGFSLFYLLGNRNQRLKFMKKKNPLKRTGMIPHFSFAEIGGQHRAKNELKEALEFLMYREQMKAYGIRPLKGILIFGPSGTGKTLMAKASASYTDSVFISASGSEFIEMYVGVGAQRIRDLFDEARESAKKNHKKSAIIFIDEIDVIGGKRDGSQQKEYDQTLNQLLTEMDGIKVHQDVQMLVIAATNRKDLLDSALLRPGRFDRHILVDLPDKRARKQIIELCMQNKPMEEGIDLHQVAQETFGFSGAQLESVTNEAAIYALRDQEKIVMDKHLKMAIDKVLMGEQVDREASEEEKERIAVHELGHAILSETIESHSVSHISLAPRGQAMGYVRHYPPHDRYLYTKKQLEEQIYISLAGAAAEQLIYQTQSTGAKNDFQEANQYMSNLIDSGLSDLGIIQPDWVAKPELQKEASRQLERLFQETIKRLQPYEEQIRSCLAILVQEEGLSGEEFRFLLHGGERVEESVTKGLVAGDVSC